MAIDPKNQLPKGAKTVNEEFFDALVRHQIGLMRLSGSIRNDVIEILDATEEDIAAKIRRRLGGSRGLETPADVRRLNRLLKSIRATRLTAWEQVDEVWVREMLDLAQAEPVTVDGILKTVVPVTLDTVIPTTALLNSIVATRPFEGKTMKQWSRSIARTDLRRIEDQIKIGMVQGESSAAIARRVVGTVSLNGKDGVTEITRRNAAAITRTAVTAISNQAKREFYKANKTLFVGELFTATLDARTTRICSSLDGKVFPVGEGPIPPLHFSCRSLRVAIIGDEAIGRRPAKPFTQRQFLREFTKENKLISVMDRARLPFGNRGKFDEFKRARIRELTGRVPAKVSYGEWLGGQSAAFQDDVLGKTRSSLFRRGKLQLDRFVGRVGNELPLRELAKRDRKAFIDAGLDPEEFI